MDYLEKCQLTEQELKEESSKVSYSGNIFLFHRLHHSLTAITII